MTKIVGTLGPKSRSVEVISACLNAGMSVARFDFSWGDVDYHQETLENLKAAIKSTKKLCAVMLDTVGPELQVVNKSEKAISLEADTLVVISTWGVRNKIDFLSLSYTRHAEDVRQVFLFQKAAVYKCNMAGKPAVVTRVVDSMTDNLRPTRAEATDVANAILDGIAESTNATNESVLKVALDHGKASGLIKSHDRVVVCQKVGDASVVKIIELED
ncbi:hypothetical protein B296_00021115 [Ensete ventricosum]|uniref:pyruvate kinase n=1 Tax=Ensete ventricosum TaxID=4639 RepID=A0A427A9R6_ENSVE|nr:hypothetical protein B296_00021115 [Ensete ventricosum]